MQMAIDNVKVRKQGNSLSINLTKKLNLKEGQELYLYRNKLGFITLVPKLPNLYKTATKEELENMDPDGLAKSTPITESNLNVD
ncbi:type II toxin-antitoxin system PemI/MazE family antitoxin [Xylocopilactobacillus apis]|uniref:AbrB family transcriptional regulator n=1 Tax=Xylocopilactobacillus apis TaxID=2932183 RepID=A0AAU9CSY4_9LACO|nr:hypothetical protein [Xylocopilactobacillus apis]BDR57112.1 hypothetical protein KIMC2_16740 [Xylocopilactobacillus apis]